MEVSSDRRTFDSITPHFMYWCWTLVLKALLRSRCLLFFSAVKWCVNAIGIVYDFCNCSFYVPMECCFGCENTQVNEEHYIFSTFGVLHIYTDKTSESMSLAAWQREAVLFTAARQIPFFKYYLVRKTFHRF